MEREKMHKTDKSDKKSHYGQWNVPESADYANWGRSSTHKTRLPYEPPVSDK